MKIFKYILLAPMLVIISGCSVPDKPQSLITNRSIELKDKISEPVVPLSNETIIYILNDASNEDALYVRKNGQENIRLKYGEYAYIKMKNEFNTVEFDDSDSGYMAYNTCFTSTGGSIFILLSNLEEMDNNSAGSIDYLNNHFQMKHDLLTIKDIGIEGVPQAELNKASSDAKAMANLALAVKLLTPKSEEFYYSVIPNNVGINNLNNFQFKEVHDEDSKFVNLRYIDIISKCNIKPMIKEGEGKLKDKPLPNSALLTFAFTEVKKLSDGERKLFTIWNEDGLVAHFNESKSVFQMDIEEGKHYFYLSDESAYIDTLEVNVDKDKHYMVKIIPKSFYKAIPLDMNTQNEYLIKNGSMVETVKSQRYRHISLPSKAKPAIELINNRLLPLLMQNIRLLEANKETAQVILNNDYGK